MSTISLASTELFQDFLGKFHTRKVLISDPLNQPSEIAAPAPYPGDDSFDSNVVMVLSILLCAFICSLGLNSLIRILIRCCNLVPSDSSSTSSSPRLASTGVKQKALKTFPVVKYSKELKFPGLDTECVICISEFLPGERVLLLPICNHGFHVPCIDKWLRSHSTCPKCRQCLIETCKKIVGCSPTSSLIPSMQVQETMSIPPLEAEGVVRNYRSVS